MAVVCIGDKIETSILTTLNLINLGVPKVIAKATTLEQGEVLEKLGAKRCFIQKKIWLYVLLKNFKKPFSRLYFLR